MKYLKAKGYLTPKERKWLFKAAKDTFAQYGGGASLVNIGVQYGASVVCFLEGAPGANITAIDVDLSLYEGEKPSNLALIESDSSLPQAYELLEDIDLLFVDGSHHTKGVQSDIDNYVSRVVPGGKVAFHDCLGAVPTHAVVNDVVQRWIESSDDWGEIESVDSMRIFERAL